jgi:hypothetical protein
MVFVGWVEGRFPQAYCPATLRPETQHKRRGEDMIANHQSKLENLKSSLFNNFVGWVEGRFSPGLCPATLRPETQHKRRGEDMIANHQSKLENLKSSLFNNFVGWVEGRYSPGWRSCNPPPRNPTQAECWVSLRHSNANAMVTFTQPNLRKIR